MEDIMSYKWDDMTKTAWNESEVMQEFEKNLLEAIAKFQKLAGVSDKMREMSDAARLLDESLVADELGDELRDEPTEGDEILAPNIEPALEAYDEYDEPENLSFSDDEHELAREQLVGDLREMAREAAYKGNIKLAYKIERAVDEILEEL